MHLDIDGIGGAFMTSLWQLKRFEARIPLFKSLDCPLALAAAGMNQRFTRYPPVINHNLGWCNSLVTYEFLAQRPVTRSFDVFFDLRLNERLSKQSWGWWFETPLRPLWRHCHVSNESLRSPATCKDLYRPFLCAVVRLIGFLMSRY